MKSRSITRYLPILLVIALALCFALALSVAPVASAFASDVEIVMTTSSEHPYALEQILTVEDIANTYYLKVEKGATPYNFYTEDPLQFPIGTNVMEAIEWHLYDDADCMILADAAINALVNVDYAEIDELTPLSVNWLSAAPDSVGQYALVFHTGTKDTSDPDYSTLAGVRFTLYDPEAASTPQALDLVITVTDREICYGDAALAQKDYVYNVSGKDADMVGELNFENALYTCSYTQWDDAGNYTITLSGVQSDDYTFTLVPGTLTVNPKSISDLEDETITVVINDGAPYFYDGDAHEAAYVISYFGHEVTFETTTQCNSTDAGDYTDIVSGTGNYIGERTIPWTIEKRELTIDFSGKKASKVYGDEAWADYIADVEEHNFYVSVLGLVGDDLPEDVIESVALWDEEDREAELGSKMKGGVYRWVAVSMKNGNYAITNEEHHARDDIYYSFGEEGTVEVLRKDLTCTIGAIPDFTYGVDCAAELTARIALDGWLDEEDEESFANDTRLLDFCYANAADAEDPADIDEDLWDGGTPYEAGEYYIRITIGKNVCDDYYGLIVRYKKVKIVPKEIEIVFNKETLYDDDGNPLPAWKFTYADDEGYALIYPDLFDGYCCIVVADPTAAGEGYTAGLANRDLIEDVVEIYWVKGGTTAPTDIDALTKAGNYILTVKAVGNPNYIITNFIAESEEPVDTLDFGRQLVVEPKPLDVEFGEIANVTYGEPFVSPTLDGEVNGFTVDGFIDASDEARMKESLRVTYRKKGMAASGEEIPTEAGEYFAIVEFEVENYLPVHAEAAFTIGEATLTSLGVAQKDPLIYNKRAQTATVNALATAVNGRRVTFTYSATENGIYTVTPPAFIDAGSYTVYYKATADSHKEAKGSFTVIIAKKAITVTAENKESECGVDLMPLTFVGDIEAGDVVCTIGTNTDKGVVGVYDITLTSTNNTNYDVILVNGKYVVKEAVGAPEEEPVLPEINGETSTVTEIVDDMAASADGVDVTNNIKNFLAAAALASNDRVDLSFEIGEAKGTSVTFDMEALKALAEKGGEIKLSYKETKKADIDQTNHAIKNAELMIEVSLVGGTFDGGKATITTAFEVAVPEGKVAVLYYVAPDGNKEKVDATFENGKLTFTTIHFSTYIVEYEGAEASGLSGGAIAGIVVGSVAAAAGIAFCVYYFVFRKKGDKSRKSGDGTPSAQ